MGTIKISHLQVNAIIGTLAHEKIRRQNLLLDLEFDYDSKSAAANDDLFASVDYSAVERAVVKCVSESRFALLDFSAFRIRKERFISTDIDPDNDTHKTLPVFAFAGFSVPFQCIRRCRGRDHPGRKSRSWLMLV
jgi:dihydroneopterin aldolase